MRILVCAFSCHPSRGSEPFSGWSIVEGMLRRGHEVHVITASDPDSANREGKLRVHRIGVPHWPGYLHRLNYSIWHRKAAKLAHTMAAATTFDVVHHVTYGTVQAACPLSSLAAPFVLGPAGGGQTAPRQFWRDLGVMLPLELLRSARVMVSPWRPSVRAMFRGSHGIIASNKASAKVAQRAGAKHVYLLPDCCSPPGMLSERPRPRADRRSGLVLWNGGIRRIKGLTVALEAFNAIGDPAAHLIVAGDGPLRSEAERVVASFGMAGRVSFVGRVDWQEMAELYRQALVVLVTGFRDSFGSQFLEAGAAGTPCVCLDLHGPADLIPNSAVLRVSPIDRSAIPALMADAVTRLLQDAELWSRTSLSVREFAERQDMNVRAELIERIYSTTA